MMVEWSPRRQHELEMQLVLGRREIKPGDDVALTVKTNVTCESVCIPTTRLSPHLDVLFGTRLEQFTDPRGVGEELLLRHAPAR